MSLDDDSAVRAHCRTCARRNRHEILQEVEHGEQNEYMNESEVWQIIRCLGCHTVAFRHVHEDFDVMLERPDGTLSHSTEVKEYPRVFANHRGIRNTYLLPELIRVVYTETLTALGENSSVLASIGLRSCIEAVCNDLGLSAASLEKRIDQLFKAGHVSNGDKKRLHVIRFLGNDAAHEIKKPKTQDVRTALEIVEHLLNSVYILKARAAGLDTVVETTDEFLKLITICAAKHKSDQPITLAGLLGKQRRLVGNQLDQFEIELKKSIAAGELPFLTLGSNQSISGKPVQLYEVDEQLVPKPALSFVPS